jgi:hypothetical protein
VTQVEQEQWPATQPGAAQSGYAAPAQPDPPARPWPGIPVQIDPGLLMQKLIPHGLVEPYLSSQRSVIAGYVQPADSSTFTGPSALTGTAEVWALRWRALEMQMYLSPEPTPAGPPGSGHADSRYPPSWLYIEAGPIPVGTEMYRITAAGEEFIARYDGQAWLRPPPEV